MTEEKYEWHRLTDAEDSVAGERELSVREVNHKTLCFTRLEGKLCAFYHKCPHAGGELSEGYLDARGNIVCPIHRYKFDVRNGRNTSGEGYYLSTYPVEQREDGIYVGFPKKRGLLDLFK
jgi:3-phenylpropionate/trans-cinnamate dioxygenase ferredoxin subunit